jgi:serine/threonine-protein kinase
VSDSREGAAAKPRPAGALVGELVGGKYRITRSLGVEGEVERYLAEHAAIERVVELRRPTEGARADGPGAALLKRAARALGNAHHPNLQGVLDSGRDESGRPYVALEPLSGRSLTAWLRGGQRMSEVRAARLVAQVLEGLRKLHDTGVVLRELGSGDLFFERETETDDFVKLRPGRWLAFYRPGVGTVIDPARPTGYSAYLAPEIRRGDVGLDPRVDLYSVGVIFRELVTGSPRGDAGGVSEAAQRMIERACADDPDERFADADAFLQGLAVLLPMDERSSKAPAAAPADPLHADLAYLRLRRSSRIVMAPEPEEDGSVELLLALFVIEVAHRRFGAGLWPQVERQVPEARVALPRRGDIHARAQAGVPAAVFSRVLGTIDQVAGQGDLTLLPELGEACAQRGLGKLMPELPTPLRPEALAAGWPILLRRLRKDGRGFARPGGPRGMRLAVESQRAPTLEVTALIAGFLRGALRSTGVREPRVLIVEAEAVGDPLDLYALDWRD